VTGVIYLALTSCLSALQMYGERLTAYEQAAGWARAAAGGCAWTRRCRACQRRERWVSRSARPGEATRPRPE